MNASAAGHRICSLALLAVLGLAAMSSDLRAQERWGEVGLDGMAFTLDGEMIAWPGFALNFGAWRKNYAIEGYALFLLYLPIAFGGSVIVTPFRASKVIPYLSAGGIVSLPLLDEGALTILNAGAGLKIPFNSQWGIRAEYRFLYFKEDGRWQTGDGVFFGIYASFGRKTGPRFRP